MNCIYRLIESERSKNYHVCEIFEKFRKKTKNLKIVQTRRTVIILNEIDIKTYYDELYTQGSQIFQNVTLFSTFQIWIFIRASNR